MNLKKEIYRSIFSMKKTLPFEVNYIIKEIWKINIAPKLFRDKFKIITKKK